MSLVVSASHLDTVKPKIAKARRKEGSAELFTKSAVSSRFTTHKQGGI